jgi:DNA-binding IclR family transcriptional regulator
MNRKVLVMEPTITPAETACQRRRFSRRVNAGVATEVGLETNSTVKSTSFQESRDDSGSPSRTLEKGLQVLSLFDVTHPEWTLKDIREKAGLPKATGFRLVKTLENLKYLAYDARSRTYHLGSAMMKAAYLTLSNSGLLRIAGPYVQALADTTTETIDLSVWTDQGAMIVHTVYTPRPFRPYNPPGMVMSGLTNSHSKLFVAFGPEGEWDKEIAENARRTEYSITDPEELREELRKVRREGVAYGLQEHNVGMCAVGAPVFDSTGEVRAGLAVVAPTERFNSDRRLEYAAAVKDIAARLSSELGYRAGRAAGAPGAGEKGPAEREAGRR